MHGKGGDMYLAVWKCSAKVSLGSVELNVEGGLYGAEGSARVAKKGVIWGGVWEH